MRLAVCRSPRRRGSFGGPAATRRALSRALSVRRALFIVVALAVTVTVHHVSMAAHTAGHSTDRAAAQAQGTAPHGHDEPRSSHGTDPVAHAPGIGKALVAAAHGGTDGQRHAAMSLLSCLALLTLVGAAIAPVARGTWDVPWPHRTGGGERGPMLAAVLPPARAGPDLLLVDRR